MILNRLRAIALFALAAALLAACVTTDPQPPIAVEAPDVAATPIRVAPAVGRVRVVVDRWFGNRQIYLPGPGNRTAQIGPAQSAALMQGLRAALGPDVVFDDGAAAPSTPSPVIEVRFGRADMLDLLGPNMASPSLSTSLRAVEIEYELIVKDATGRAINTWKLRGAAPTTTALVESEAWIGALRGAIADAAGRIAMTGRALLSPGVGPSTTVTIAAAVPILPTPLTATAGFAVAVPVTMMNAGSRPVLVLRDQVAIVPAPGMEPRLAQQALDWERNLRRFQESSPATRAYHRSTGMSQPGGLMLEVFMSAVDAAKTGGGRARLDGELAPVVGKLLDDAALKPGESLTAYALFSGAVRFAPEERIRLRVPVIDVETGAVAVHEVLSAPIAVSGF